MSEIMLYQVTDDLDAPPVNPDPTWFRQCETFGLCHQCRRVLPTHMPRPIEIYVDGIPKGVPMTRAGVLFPSPLLDLVLPMTSGHVRGKCFRVVNGEPHLIPEYGTLYALPEARVFLRGGPKSAYRICPNCKTQIGFAVDPTYLLSFQLRKGQVTYQDQYDRFYVNETIAAAIERLRYPNLVLQPIPVRDKPIDNEWIPGDPNWWD